jgi:hypothetical protein
MTLNSGNSRKFMSAVIDTFRRATFGETIPLVMQTLLRNALQELPPTLDTIAATTAWLTQHAVDCGPSRHRLTEELCHILVHCCIDVGIATGQSVVPPAPAIPERLQQLYLKHPQAISAVLATLPDEWEYKGWVQIHEMAWCGICMDSNENTVVTQCGHIFCYECFSAWCEQNSRTLCPICRTCVAEVVEDGDIEDPEESPWDEDTWDDPETQDESSADDSDDSDWEP